MIEPGSAAPDFTLENLTVHNLTPHGGTQAEALRVNGDRCILRDCDFLSFQDTLLLTGRVYVTNCYIEGDVDFIWGQGAAFFENCEIQAVHDGYYLQARNSAEHAGFVFSRCQFTAAPGVARCWLARVHLSHNNYSLAPKPFSAKMILLIMAIKIGARLTLFESVGIAYYFFNREFQILEPGLKYRKQRSGISSNRDFLRPLRPAFFQGEGAEVMPS